MPFDNVPHGITDTIAELRLSTITREQFYEGTRRLEINIKSYIDTKIAALQREILSALREERNELNKIERSLPH